MKLFQKLLVAPAALGLLAPLAANAAEVNINDVAGYATPTADVTTAQFSDVVPGDWAYTALQNLSESYGCVDNAYTQNLKSGQALTRYEAAALVNACLEGGIASADVSADATRLSNEFGTEMAILKGRVDGLEYKVQELSAGQFSSSTKMSGGAVFTTGFIDDGIVANAGDDNKLATEFNFTLDLNTSFTGEDVLYTQLVSGNQGELVLENAETSNGNALEVQSLYYSFPLGDFQVTAGPLLDSDDVVAATTSIYSDNFRLGGMRFGLGGNDSDLAAATGPGAAIAWANDNGVSASYSLIAQNGDAATSGIFSREGDDIMTATLGYDSDNWGGGLVYGNADDNVASGGSPGATSFGGGLYFRPDGFPTVSVTYDTASSEVTGVADSNALMIGMDYEVGAGTASVAYESMDLADDVENGTDSRNSYEIYYNYPVNDGMSVQAGYFVEEGANDVDTTGYIVETFFSF